ncbi:FtsX-like permease family protein, partial [Pseudomonas sp.]|uniref:FtsX-like permease family protein n=1 Tax=Pseudomonas sp. TaxID=306 RepID=UPI0028ACEFEF
QRRGLIRTLRACGVNLRTVLTALAIELGLFAVLGGLAGVAGGYLLAALLLPDVAASMRGLYGAQVAGQLSLSPAWWATGLLVSVAGALLAGVSAVWRAAHLPLLALAQAQ